MLTQIYNGNVLIPGGRWVRGGSVLIKDSMIAEIYSHSRILEGVDRAVNAAGIFNYERNSAVRYV